MVKCEECISFAICVHKIIVSKYRDEYTFDTHEIHNCEHFRERFFNRRNPISDVDRDILKLKILKAHGLA